MQPEIALEKIIISDIAYTIIFDFANRLISQGQDAEKVLEVATEVIKIYSSGINDKLKIRQKPAPRKSTQSDIVTLNKQLGAAKLG